MLYLLRHGRTAANAEHRLQGRIDPPLDDLGRRQAAAIAAHILDVAAPTGGIDRVIASPLARARETAAYLGIDMTIDERWMEMAYGEYEGVGLAEVPPEVWQSWYDDPDFAAAGGESFGELHARVESAVAEFAESDENVVIVSHVTPIKAAVSWTLGAGYDTMFRCHLSQASLTTIGFGRFGPVLHQFNHTVAPAPAPQSD